MADAIEPPALPVSRPFLELRPLLRIPGIASDARKILLAAAGLIALHAGWAALDAVFGPPGALRTPGLPPPTLEAFPEVPRMGGIEVDWRLTDPFRMIVASFGALFTRGIGPADWCRTALKAAWAAVAWGIFGGAIARVAMVQAAIGRRVGLGTAVRFALGKAGPLIGAPMTPMLAVAVLALGSALFGLLYRLPSPVGGLLGSVFGFIPLGLGLVMAIVLVGLAIGWPLMHATVAAEGEDAADALSRSYSYVNQRLVRYVAHAAIALAIGSVALIAVGVFARVVLGLTDWGVSLGAPDRLDDWGANGRIFWNRFVGLLVLSWVYSYFWSAAAVLYLILRRDVDGTPWHQVYLPEHDADTFAGDLTPEPVKKAVEAEVGQAGSRSPSKESYS